MTVISDKQRKGLRDMSNLCYWLLKKLKVCLTLKNKETQKKKQIRLKLCV